MISLSIVTSIDHVANQLKCSGQVFWVDYVENSRAFVWIEIKPCFRSESSWRNEMKRG